MIERTYDAAFINRVANDPQVRPALGGEGELDLSEVIARPEHWFLMGPHGGFVLSWSAPGVREVHTMILPEGRGKLARQAAAETIEYVREHGCRMLWTKIPPHLPHVAGFASAMGMQPTGETIETFGLPYAIYMMEI